MIDGAGAAQRYKLVTVASKASVLRDEPSASLYDAVSHLRGDPFQTAAEPGIALKSVVCAAMASLCLLSTPAVAQERLVARMLTDVCLPYATRARSFEKTIRAARDLQFRRPAGSDTPLDDWASEIDLISDDGNWRLRIEEGSLEEGDGSVYAASCTISSRHASVRDLADLGRRAFRDPARWSTSPDNLLRWDRRTPRPDEYRLSVKVAAPADTLPTMTITGYSY